MSPFYFNDIIFVRWLALIWSFFSLGEALFVYLRNRKSLLNCLWAGVSLGVGIWCFGCYLLLVSQTKIEAVFASRILQFGSIPIPILQLHFAYLFIDISKKRRRLLCAGYVLTFILLISDLFTPFFLSDVSPNLYFRFFPVAGYLYHIFTFMYFGISFYWIYILTKSLPSLSPLKRNQAKYVAIASVIGIIGGGSTFFLVYNIPIPPFPA